MTFQSKEEAEVQIVKRVFIKDGESQTFNIDLRTKVLEVQKRRENSVTSQVNMSLKGSAESVDNNVLGYIGALGGIVGAFMAFYLFIDIARALSGRASSFDDAEEYVPLLISFAVCVIVFFRWGIKKNQG